ncbi:aminotransferase class I/II-fold pyridoxal phosphate-dependent enzyme [Candidatus Chloroploca sp. M-50]|uniref:Aminotransferase n=1 Tax=Candidatus Chloroploca mongolica TaxID=2528176 RepID=A0ABS4DCL3_9CHLR|nr:aminotransferase class I/II-fold pyridoxal phosphate-dependent enzyme [Candidatus Chloroploca mongolica]MBP1467183.1 aminotransferase class I/II-fold pyridoxal phosphate-dependent enzyme [Candidatus Chloroploca mongolica]
MSSERISRRVRGIPPSGIRRFFDIAATMPDVISLGVGEPDFMTPAAIRQAGQRSIDQTTAYTSNSGLYELREAVVEHLKQRYNVMYDAEHDVLMTVGVSEAMAATALALFDPGDEVLMPEPCFVAYMASVQLADARPVYVPTQVEERFQVTGAALEAAITPRTKAIMIGYPNNPTGAVLSPERMHEIAEVARRHDLLVLSDEIYDRLVYGVEHTCFASLPGMRDRTVLFGGFSKAYAMTGWRLGWMAAPEEITAAVRKVHQYAIMSAPTMSQYAGIEALRHGEASVQAMVAEYDRRRRVIVDGLNTIGLKTFEPQGAFYAFPFIGHLGMTSEQFCDRLLAEEHVAVIPGDAFGPSGAGYVRACYATSMEKIEVALERIERFVRRIA